MTRPVPTPVDPTELPALAQETIRKARFAHLATVDGDQPRLRPVSPVRTQGFTIHVASLRRYGKTQEIQNNPKVELCYLDSDHNQVRITGIARVESNREVLAGIWEDNPLMRGFLSSIDDPELLVYRIDPKRVRFMREWALEYQEVPLRDEP